MKRLTLLLLCVCFVTTRTEQSAEINEVISAGPFLGYKTYTGVVTIRQLGDTSSCPPAPWTPEQTAARIKKFWITFPRPYATLPLVSFAVSYLDVNAGYNLRYIVDILDVTKRDFIIQFHIWCNTYIYGAQVKYWVTGFTTTESVQSTSES